MSSQRRPQSAEGAPPGLEPDEEAVPFVQDEDQLPIAAPHTAQVDRIVVGTAQENIPPNMMQIEEPLEASEVYPAGEASEDVTQQIVDDPAKINAIGSIPRKESSKNSIVDDDNSSVISNRGYFPPGRTTVTVAVTAEVSAEANQNSIIQDACGPPPTIDSGESELLGYEFSGKHRENKEITKGAISIVINKDGDNVLNLEGEGHDNGMTEIADGGMRSTREAHSFRFDHTATSSSPANRSDQLPHLQSFVSGTFDVEDTQDVEHVAIPDVIIEAEAPLESESLVTDGDTHQDCLSVVASLQASQVGAEGSVVSSKQHKIDTVNGPDMETSLMIGFDDEKMSLAEGEGIHDEDSIGLGLAMDSSLVSSIAEGDFPIDGAFNDFDAPDFPSNIPVPSSSRPVTSDVSQLAQTSVDSTQSHQSVTRQSVVPNPAMGHQERSLSERQLCSGMQSPATPADAYVNTMQLKLTKRLSGTAKEPKEVSSDTGGGVSNVSEDDGTQVEQDMETRNSLIVREEQTALSNDLQSVQFAAGKEAQAVKRNELLQKTIPMDLGNEKNTGSGGSSSNSTVSDTPGKKAVRFAMADNVNVIDSVNEKSTAPWGPPPGGFPPDSDHDSDSETPIMILPKSATSSSSIPPTKESIAPAATAVPATAIETPKPIVKAEPEKAVTKSVIKDAKPSTQLEHKDDVSSTVKFVPAPLTQTRSGTRSLHQSYVYNEGDFNKLAEKVQVQELLQPTQSFHSRSGTSTATSSFALLSTASSSSMTNSFTASSEVATTVAAAATGISGKLAKQKLRGYVLGAKSIDLGAGGQDNTDVEGNRLAAVAEAERLHRLREEHERKKLEAELAKKAKLEEERKRIEEQQQLEEERMNRYGTAKSLGFHSFKVGLSRKEYEKMKVNSIYIRPSSPLKPASPPKPVEVVPVSASSPTNSSQTNKPPLTRSLSNMSPANIRRPSRRVSILKTILKPMPSGLQSHESAGNESVTSSHFSNSGSSNNNNNNDDNNNNTDANIVSNSSDMRMDQDTLTLRPSSKKTSASQLPKSVIDTIVSDIQADDLIDKRFGWQKDSTGNGILATTAVGKVERSVTSSSQLLHQLRNDGVLSGKANSYSSTHNDGLIAPQSKSFFAKSFRAMRSNSISMMQQSGNSGNNSAGGAGIGDMNAVRNTRAKRANAADFIPSFDDEYHPHSIFEHYSGFIFHDPHHEFYQRPWDADLFPERYHLESHPPRPQRLIHSAGGALMNTTGAGTRMNTASASTGTLLPSSSSAPSSPSPFSMPIPAFGASTSASSNHLVAGMSSHNLSHTGGAGMGSKPSSSGLGGGGGGGGKRYLKAGYMINCYRPWSSERKEDELEEFVKRSLASVSSCEDWESDDGNLSRSDYSGSEMLSVSSANVSVASSPLHFAALAQPDHHGPESVDIMMGDDNSGKLPPKRSNSALRSDNGNNLGPPPQRGNTGGGDDLSLSSSPSLGGDDEIQRALRSAQRQSSSSLSSKQTRLRSRRHQLSEEAGHDADAAAAASARRSQFPPISSPAAAQQRESSSKPILLLEDLNDRKKKQKKGKAKSRTAKNDKDVGAKRKAGGNPCEPARQRLVINIIEALPGFVLPASP